MEGSHKPDLRQSPVFRRLEQFVTEVRSQPAGSLGTFADFELAVRGLLMGLGREILAEELARYDVTAPEIEVEDVTYRRALRCRQTYMSACGPVTLERELYRPRGGDGRAICPLEERVGTVGGFWTPRAAREAANLVAHVTPGEAETLLREMTGMDPSKTSLDHLPKTLSAVWETNRVAFEATVRQGETIPVEATTVAISLDGVLAPMRDGEGAAKQEQTEGKRPTGPAGYREVGCATLSFYNAEGDRLSTLRWARMPEVKKVTLCAQIEAELRSVLASRPDLQLVKIADGAACNWEFLSSLEPAGEEILDFFHAAEHLKSALDAAYGEYSLGSRAAFEKHRLILKESERGVDQVIRVLTYLRKRGTGRKVVTRELRYFRNQRARMRYATYLSQNLPIGSDVLEAACKTLVAQRMKRSEMRWLSSGGQAILTLRSLIQSDRWERAWGLLSEAFKTPVLVTYQVRHLTVLKAA
jgi:hypothetical protein